MTFFDTARQDVRYAARLLAKDPAFTAVAALSLALGIGANTAIFGIVNAVMLRSLPVQHPQELLQVKMGESGSFTNPIWEELRNRQDVFSGVFAWWATRFNLAAGGEVQYAEGLWASGGYFSTLGVPAAAGRMFTQADDRRGCAPVAVLSYAFWQRRYGARQDAVGQTIRLDGHPFQIIGVSAPGFSGVDVGRSFDVALPICTEPVIRGETSALDRRSSWWLSVIGRPKPGLAPAQVGARLKVLAPQVFEATVPPNYRSDQQAKYRQRSFDIAPAGTGTSHVRRRYGNALTTLMVVTAIVLLIACANIANLMLARAATRQREVALRLALGASRTRLIRQLLTESVLLSLLGASLGLAFAWWGSALLIRFISSTNNLVVLDLGIDLRLLGFTAAAGTLTGVLSGLAPAIPATRPALNSALKEGGRGNTGGRSHFRLGRILVAAQVTLSLFLLVGAGLFVRTFLNLVHLDAGFVRENVLIVEVDTRSGNYPADQRTQLFDRLLDQARQIPAVRSASRSDLTPVSGSSWNDAIHPEGYTAKSEMDGLVWFNRVSAGYFDTLGIPLLAGRDFGRRDTTTSPGVAIVNESVARKFFPNANAVGKFYRTQKSNGEFEAPVEIIGVVKDARYTNLRDGNVGTVFVSASQELKPGRQTSLEIRTARPPAEVIPFVKAAVAAVDPRIALTFKTLATQVEESLIQERLLATLSGFFAALALLLATVGLYGVVSYMANCRRNEIGIRIALGADRPSVLWLVLREVALLIGVGLIAGAAAAAAATEFVQKMLFGIPPNDPLTFILAAALLLAVAAVAGFLPARRASRMDPILALREE